MVKSHAVIYEIHNAKTNEWIKIDIDQMESHVNQYLKHDEVMPHTHDSSMNINHYLLKYWMPILGPTTFALLLVMIQEAYGNNGLCELSLLDLARRCGMESKTFARDKIRELEANHFVCTVKRRYTDTKRCDINLYYVLPTTPLLSKEQMSHWTREQKDTYALDLKRWTSPKSIQIGSKYREELLNREDEMKDKGSAPLRTRGDFEDRAVDNPSTPLRTRVENHQQAVDNGSTPLRMIPSKNTSFVNNVEKEWGSAPLRIIHDGESSANVEGKDLKDFKDLKTKEYKEWDTPIQHHQLSTAIHKRLKEKLTEHTYIANFGDARFEFEEDAMIVVCAIPFIKDWIERRYMKLLAEIVDALDLIISEIKIVSITEEN